MKEKKTPFVSSLPRRAQRPVEAAQTVHVLPVLGLFLLAHRAGVVARDALVLCGAEAAKAHGGLHGGHVVVVVVVVVVGPVLFHDGHGSSGRCGILVLVHGINASSVGSTVLVSASTVLVVVVAAAAVVVVVPPRSVVPVSSGVAAAPSATAAGLALVVRSSIRRAGAVVVVGGAAAVARP